MRIVSCALLLLCVSCGIWNQSWERDSRFDANRALAEDPLWGSSLHVTKPVTYIDNPYEQSAASAPTAPNGQRIISYNRAELEKMDRIAPGASRFVLMHEHAHHELNHGQKRCANCSHANEIAADAWAAQYLAERGDFQAIRAAIQNFLTGYQPQNASHPSGPTRAAALRKFLR